MFHRHLHRTYIPDGIYFVTTNVRGRMPVFENPTIAKIAEESIWWQRRSQYIVYAYVIMPDHMHLLLQPTKGTISIILQSIKSNSAREISRHIVKIHSRERTLSAMSGTWHMGRFSWQQFFYDHIITDDDDFRNHVEYIRYNPVKAKLVEQPEDHLFLFVDEDAVCGLLNA